MNRFYAGLIAGLGVLALGLAEQPAAAQDRPQANGPRYVYQYHPRNVSGLVSGFEAWQLNDIRRRAEIGRQVDLQSDIYWRWSGASSYYPGVFEAWPMVPGSTWGWPAAISPPTVRGTRVAPQFDPEFADALPGSQPPEVLPAPAPSVVPAAQRNEPRGRVVRSGPREF